MRVGIIGFQHEANTFNPVPADLASFRIATGQDVITQYRPAHHEVGGYIQGLEEAGIEIVPLLVARATPSGNVTDEAYNHIMGQVDKLLAEAGKLDGLLLAPHGASVNDTYPDMDGQWLTHIRQKVGPAMPLIVTIDPHCNLSRKMVDAADAIIAYRSNPHIDQRQRGLEAARLMARTLKGEVKPTMAGAFPNIAIDIERQHTPSEPCLSLYKQANDMLKQPGVLGNSVVLGFPYADVEEMGTSFIVITDNDKAKAQQLADGLAKWLYDHRQQYKGNYISIEQAIEKVRTSPKPACLLDMGDNVGGGGPGDYTLLAQALHDTGDLKTFVSLVDPEAQKIAREAGQGNTVELSIAGKTDPAFGKPITGKFKVLLLHDGNFTEDQPRHGGSTHFDLGPTAIVQHNNLIIQITSIRRLPASLNQVLAFGLKPEQFDAIIAKGVHAPTAAFEPVCPTIIRVNTPGITTADMSKFTYHRRRKPLFPLEEI